MNTTVTEPDWVNLVEPAAAAPLPVAHARSQPVAVVSNQEAGSLIHVIAAAARDPNVDIDKMERLMAMHERMQSRADEQAFNDAMNKAQARMKPISADAANPQTKSLYATYGKLDSKIRPIYTDCGFSISFNEGDGAPEGHARILAYVSHSAGHTRTYKLDMPNDGKGAKGGDVMTKTHATGAAHSYGRRYLLKDIFNIAIGEEDNDGNGDGDGDGDGDGIGQRGESGEPTVLERFRAATTIQELSQAMSKVKPDQKKQYVNAFNARMKELQNA